MAIARRRLLAGIGAAPMVCGTWVLRGAESASPVHGKPTDGGGRPTMVSLAELGAAPGRVDFGLAINAALARLPRQGGAVLHIPPGVWHCAQTVGAVLNVEGFDRLTIEGYGAHLVFDGAVRPFVIAGCHAPSLRGFSIDWERPAFSQGDVVSVDGAGLGATILVDRDFPVDGTEVIKTIGTYDRGSGLMARHGIDAYDVVAHVARVGEQSLRLAFSRPLPLRAGQTVVLRHAVYGANALSFRRCSDVTVQDVTIHSAPGMGLYADHCAGVSVLRLNILPPPGSARLMTTTADGAHFNACSGAILVEDCGMAGMGDDCVNVHGKYFRIEQRPDDRTAIVAAAPETIAGVLHTTPDGDRLTLLDAETLHDGGQLGQVASSERRGGNSTALHFDDALSSAVRVGDYVYNPQDNAQATIRRCRFPGNRARGVLVHADSLIEQCQFSGQSAEAILLLPDLRFSEGPAAERVTIRENHIADVCRIGSAAAAIRIGVGGVAAVPSPVNRDIVVSHNRFADLHGPAVLAQSTANLRVDGNRIEGTSGLAMVFQAVTGVWLTRNVCVPSAAVAAGAEDKAEIRLDGNLGLTAS